MTYARQGVLKTTQFKMESASQTVEIPIDEALTPGFVVRFDLVGSSPRLNSRGQPDPNLPPRPAFAQGRIQIKIAPMSRTLKVEALPEAKKLSPGTETTVTVKVSDASGIPVEGAEVAVVVIDESILALANYSFSSPIASFYSAMDAAITALDLRRFVLLVNPNDVKPPPTRRGSPSPRGASKKARSRRPLCPMAAAKLEFGGLDSEAFAEPPVKDASQTQVAVRKNFNALAAFAPSKTTDASGRTVVRVKIPDNLTRYRMVAVAVS